MNENINLPLATGHKTNKKMKRIFALTALLTAVIGSAMGQTKIRTAEELMAIGTDKEALSGSYILMNDLTLDGWMPIGRMDKDGETGFSGTFDGNGRTITLNSFYPETDNRSVGLFGVVDGKGEIKNLRVAGKPTYTDGQKFLYIGCIAGVNKGKITCCVSTAELTCEYAQTEPHKKVKALSGYEGGQYGGCIAGVNNGEIRHCYSNGSIRVALGSAAGIACGNGLLVTGSLSIGIGSGGMSMGATPGSSKGKYGFIEYCYSEASVFSSGNAGGIVVITHGTCIMNNCAALNPLIEVRGAGKPLPKASPFPGGLFGKTMFSHAKTQFYYLENMSLRRYDGNDVEQPPVKLTPKRAVPLSTIQKESWWRLPDGADRNMKQKMIAFPFGSDETAPWKWDEQRKRPVLHWEATNR